MLHRTIVAFCIVLSVAERAHGADAATLWSGKVQPLFDVHCVKCHGPLEQKSGLELDTPQAVLKGGEDGAVVVPGKPEESLLYQNLAGRADPHMPPKKQLTDDEREMVREWIAAMAVVPAKLETKPRDARKFDVSDASDRYADRAKAGRQRGVAARAGGGRPDVVPAGLSRSRGPHSDCGGGGRHFSTHPQTQDARRWSIGSWPPRNTRCACANCGTSS